MVALVACEEFFASEAREEDFYVVFFCLLACCVEGEGDAYFYNVGVFDEGDNFF